MTNDWRHARACQEEDAEVFFPLDEKTGSGPAKDICALCPVRAECLAFAFAEGITDGVFGGLTSDERRALRRGDLLRRHAAAPRKTSRLMPARPGTGEPRARGRCPVCQARQWLNRAGIVTPHSRSGLPCGGAGSAAVPGSVDRDRAGV